LLVGCVEQGGVVRLGEALAPRAASAAMGAIDQRYGGDRTDGWVIFEDFSMDAWKPPFWWEKLLADEHFVQQLIARWCVLRQDVLRLPNLILLIDTWTALLDEAQARNYKHWEGVLEMPIGSEPVAFPTYTGEVQEFKAFLEARLEWIDSHIRALPGGIASTWSKRADNQSEWSDAAGWNDEPNYSTMRLAVARDDLYLLARGKAGVDTWRFDTCP